MKVQSVSRGFSVLAFAGITVKILSLLYIPFLLAIISDEGYGIYSAAYMVYVLIYAISNAGIPVAISKSVSELVAVGNYKDAIRSFKIARSFLLIIGIIMSIVMFLFASSLSKAIHFEKAYLAIVALSPTLLFTSVASSYRGYFQGRGNMTPTAISQIIEQVVNTIFTLVFAALLMRFGLVWACAGGTIGTSLGALFSAVFLVMYHKRYDRYVVPRLTNSNVKRYSYTQLVKKVTNYSIPITLCIGMQYAGNLVDLANTKIRLGVAGFSEVGATELYGQLVKYQQLLNAPLAITVALAAAILPAIAGAVALKNREQVQQKIDFALRLCFFVTIPSAVGFAVLSTPLFAILQYGAGAYLMEFGSIALILLAVVQIQTSILQGAGKLYMVTLNLVLGIIGKIVTNYFLISIPQINIMGAIIGSVVGYCIPITLNFLIMKKVLKIKIHPLRLLLKPMIAAVTMGITVYIAHGILSAVLFFIPGAYGINLLATLISVMIGAVTYFIVLVMMKGVSSEELEIFPKRLVRLIPQKMRDRIE